MTHHLLYWLDTSWWSLGLARTQLLHVSNTCPLCLPWSESLFAHLVTHPWLLMAWAIFWFLILYGPFPLGAGLCLIVSFFFLRPILLFLFAVLLPFPVVPFCHSCCGIIWPQPAGPFWACCLFLSQWLNVVIWALYYMACGLFCPIYFLLCIIGPFAFLRLPWPFF